MRNRTFIPAAGAVTVSLVASLICNAPSSGPEPARAPTTVTVNAARLADVADRAMPASDVTDGFNSNAIARWRRRGSTVDRCERAERRPVTRATGPRRVVSPDQVARGGCEYFLRHGTIDMDELAVQLSVSRATLYRVVHSRDRLLADVLWRLAENALLRARRERTQYGVEGVLEVARHFSAVLLDAKPFRKFLSSEPDAAARILLTTGGGVHDRAVEAQKAIFAEATPPGQLWLTSDADSVAYLLVRIMESTMYADLLASRQPDRDLAERAIRAVLPASPVTASPITA